MNDGRAATPIRRRWREASSVLPIFQFHSSHLYSIIPEVSGRIPAWNPAIRPTRQAFCPHRPPRHAGHHRRHRPASPGCASGSQSAGRNRAPPPTSSTPCTAIHSPHPRECRAVSSLLGRYCVRKRKQCWRTPSPRQALPAANRFRGASPAHSRICVSFAQIRHLSFQAFRRHGADTQVIRLLPPRQSPDPNRPHLYAATGR